MYGADAISEADARHLWNGVTSEPERERHCRIGEALYAAGRASQDEELQGLQAALRDARAALHRDRSGLASALVKITDEVRGRAWISQDRGPYAWDDERYKKEAGVALCAVDSIATAALQASGTLVSPIIRSIDRLLPGAVDDSAGLFDAGKRSRDEEVDELRAERDRAIAQAETLAGLAGSSADRAAAGVSWAGKNIR